MESNPVGRPRTFKSPDELKKAWEDYKEKLKQDSKQWPKVQYVGKDGDRKEDYPVMPYTLEGFKIYCRATVGEADHYFKNTEEKYTDFCHICSHVKEEIRMQQITGGLLGFFNPSITQRLNGLTEKTENKNENTNIEVKAEFGVKKVD